MKPIRLYINNFMCYDRGYIDFSKFNTALIVGKVSNSDLYSNGVGKTTIFKAIEYVLFNQAAIGLEHIIRDDMPSCNVVFDFSVDNKEYRLSRSRTKKGSADLTFLERNTIDGTEYEVYHSTKYEPFLDKKNTKNYWKDLSGSRAGDTEKDLLKLIKINHKSFRSTVLFPQHDITGLATATPEKRRGILKDALNLAIYSKLEKIAKEELSSIDKDIFKYKTLIESLGYPYNDIIELTFQVYMVDDILYRNNKELHTLNDTLSQLMIVINEYKSAILNIENKYSFLLEKEKQILFEKSKLDSSIKEYQTKKSNTNKFAKELINDINNLKDLQDKYLAIDYSKKDLLIKDINTIKDKITEYNFIIKNNIDKYEELKIPLPNNDICKDCRQQITEDYKKECKEKIINGMAECQKNISLYKSKIVSLNEDMAKFQQEINSINLYKQKLENINFEISTKNKEIQDKKSLYDEYNLLLNKFIEDSLNKNKELDLIKLELSETNVSDIHLINDKILQEQNNINALNDKILKLNKEIVHYNNNKIILDHTISQKYLDSSKKDDLNKLLLEIEEKALIYPLVIQAFSSTGISNLIIQNILDDLQIESNNLLTQLKPGLQLSFSTEKTVEKTGDQAETLEINYKINGKERYYEQLSGAMQIAVAFSLKLGLSFILQKIIGTEIKFLLLDEIDQPLDKASVDAFVDIVKFFQKDFTILVITHNDRLKDKFSSAILVEQDSNMISTASVVSNW